MAFYRALLLSFLCLVFLTFTGCHGAGGDLSGFWTETAENGVQVTRIKLEKSDKGYRMISIPGMPGKCITADMPMPMTVADKDSMADMQIKGLQQALVDTDNPRVRFLVGPQGDWTVNSKHMTSGYAFDFGGEPREVHHTDGCYALDGKLVQQ